MTVDNPAYPPGGEGWVAAILSSENVLEPPLGAAVLISADRVLTCAHVIVGDDGRVREPLWVGFPKASGARPSRVVSWEIRYEPPIWGRAIRDLAVLSLAEPAPAGVEAAPVRCPVGEDLRDKSWWAFGFPDGDPLGNSADGQVGAALSYGWVRLDTTSRYLVRPGFSGGGLWSRDYRAVVGIVGHAHSNGDARAVTLREADLCFPEQKLSELARWSAEAAGELALNQWGWGLSRDPEGVRHWQPRARGVSVDSERGYRFRGRTAALTRIVAWLGRAQPDRSALVVTGSPGVGKSAVLGRIVTTADPGIRASLPADDMAVRAETGSVSCAVHAKGKTVLEVAEEIARAASAKLPKEPLDLAPAIQSALAARDRGPFNVIIDALDEAATPAHARAIIDQIVVPLAETCADAGARLVVGTRRRDDVGDVLGRFGDALTPLDLDDPEYSAAEDLAGYALACLQLAGDERPGNPYVSDNIARPLADRIASMSGGNFLIAGLIARTHGLHDQQPADPAELAFPATVDAALAAYLDRLRPVAGLAPASLLTALAFAEAPGLPVGLWLAAVHAIYGAALRAEDLVAFARSGAANFLVESGADGGETAVAEPRVYRLFHQALNDALLRTRADRVPRADDERAITDAFFSWGREAGWENAPGYLLRALPKHAAAGGQIDVLLGDESYLLHADLRRLTPASYDAITKQARDRSRLLKLTPEAISVGPPERAALFSLTERLDQLGTAYSSQVWPAAYTAMWASTPTRGETITLEGHWGNVNAVCPLTVTGRALLASGGSDEVRIWDPATGEQLTTLQGGANSVCPVTVAGRDLLASGSDGVRIWNPATGQPVAALEGQEGGGRALCRVTVAGRDVLASGGRDGTVWIWDPATGERLTTFQGRHGWVNSVCPVTVNGRDLLASGGDFGAVWIWDPATGQQLTSLQGHRDGAEALCPVTVAGRDLLASVDTDGPPGRFGAVRIWDPATGKQLTTLQGQQGRVNAICPVTVAGRDLLAGGGPDGAVRIWDPATGVPVATLEGRHVPVIAVCPVTVAGRDLLASGGSDGAVRIWDPATGQRPTTQEGQHDRVLAVCPVTVAGRDLLASGGSDGAVRIWDPATGKQPTTLKGHRHGVLAVCPVMVAGRDLLASCGEDNTVRIWDPDTGKQLTTLKGHNRPVTAVCPVTVTGRDLLASAWPDTVRIWDPATGKQLTTLQRRHAMFERVCPVTVDGRHLLASGGTDGQVRIWDPVTSKRVATLKGHWGWIEALCPVTVAGRDLLASGYRDGAVRIWDPATGKRFTTLKGHQDRVLAVCPVTVAGRELLASGSKDRTVRIWNPATGASLIAIPVRYEVLAIHQVATLLAVALDTGILVIKLGLDA